MVLDLCKNFVSAQYLEKKCTDSDPKISFRHNILRTNDRISPNFLYAFTGPFPAFLGKGPWLELGKNMRHLGYFGNFFRSVNC